jgi:multiple sugar transport system substrate-binding protein
VSTNDPSKAKSVLSRPLTRRTAVKAATGAAAAFCATGIVGKSYRRSLAAQDDVKAQMLATSDPEEAGRLALHSTREGAFSGQTITFQGLSNTGFHVDVFEPFSAAWSEYTGANIEWIRVTQADSFGLFQQAVSTDTVEFDVLEGSGGWEGDLLGGGHAQPMPDWLLNSPEYDINDIVPYLRDPVRTWEGVTYGASIDGDTHHFNYRKDVFSDQDLAAEWASSGGEGEWGIPQTWQQVNAYHQFLFEKEFDGAPIYGMLDPYGRGGGVSAQFYFSRVSAYGKHPNDPAFFFDPEDMTPLINSPAWVRALEDMVGALPYAPPDYVNADLLKTLDDFLAGTGAMAHWWADVGSNVYTNPSSLVQGKVGYSILPGSPDVWNRQTQTWDMIEGNNYAPYLAFLGWGLYVMNEAEERGVSEAAWDLVSHLTSKNASLWMNIYPSGMNPWRESHFNAEDWTVSGFPLEEAQQYLDSIRQSYSHPNRIVDLRIPGQGTYFSEIENYTTQAIAGQIGAQEALDQAAARWDEITDSLGRDRQIQLYRASLGL